ncbi:translation initiation factor IF-2 [Candidatus Falkowbacteria bacterium]|nr:translation initiation factor IF-2 [Candidatus Falkowbacteria bacterium]NCT54800.1 translation initiation factor IF-2 [Candidatus Falkowbacteria bacterium]
MNITELARLLRISPQELRDLLPEMGFAIGQKAIKVDNNTAKKIIKEWPRLRREWQFKKEEKLREKEDEVLPKETKTVFVPTVIAVRDFADLAEIPVNRVLAELMKNGVFTSINEKIDFDTAMIIGENLNLDVKEAEVGDVTEEKDDQKLENILAAEDSADMIKRPPVIVVMGHVDHGKTSLLDSIRKTDVIAGEAGGITQHIGAYQINRKGEMITFIDTPGHEAFTAMRSRGAKVADIAILIVAADDGVKQQTIEAFKIIEAAKIPYLVAINKIDKEGADIERVKQELSTRLNIIPEDWGGKIICSPISAKAGTGVEELLDMVLLVSETEGESLRANPISLAAGTVVESNVDKTMGPLATILVQNGTLRVGDQLCFNGVIYGKVKSLKNHNGEEVESAGPSTPVKILGLKVSPAVGDILSAGEGERLKFRKMKSSNNQAPVHFSEEKKDDNTAKLNIILKTDFLGSAEAIEESLMKLNGERVKVKVLSRGLGYITEGDIKRAEDSNAKVIGFNVKMPTGIENLAREKMIEVKMFSIIYDLTKYIQEEMQLLVKPEIKRIDLGRLKVLAIFRTENESQIVGGKVLDGVVRNNSFVEVKRGDDFIVLGNITQLQSAKQDVNEVEKDEECGLKYEGKPLIEEGDILSFYQEEKIINKI